MDTKFASGAEAELIRTRILKEKVLTKKRIPKKYRHPSLDEHIRKSRMRREVSLLARAKEAGVRTPLIRDIDITNAAFSMEFFLAPTAKKALSKKNLWICSELGKMIGNLHQNDIIHGDLTTSNVLVKKKTLILIDFGLGFFSKKIEDRAVDLLNLKKMFFATHSDLGPGWNRILQSYRKTYPKAPQVEKAMIEVEKRTRYS